MNKTKFFVIVMLLVALLMGGLMTVRAAPNVPPHPSSFYGEIHFISGDGEPTPGIDYVEAYVPGITTYAARILITTSGSDQVYSIHVPGDDLTTTGVIEGGVENDVVTFKINGRKVATGIWHGGTNVQLNFHPPAGQFSGPNVGVVNETINFGFTATDWLSTDTLTYAWDLDGDGEYDDSTEQTPSHTFTTTGTKTVGIKVTDSIGGEDTLSEKVVIVALGGLTVHTYDGTPKPVSVSGLEAPYTAEVTYNGSATEPKNAGTYAVVVTIKNGTTNVGTINKTLVIEKRPITVTAVTDSKVYDGTTTSSGVPSLTIPTGFSAGGAGYTSLAFADGTPYVAYTDLANSSKASVMKFDGSRWVQVGSAGFSAGAAYYNSLAFANGIPYVAYTDVSNGWKASLMKFNGTSWEQVGSAGFSVGRADYISLAFDSSGTPYVAYQDGGNSNKASVMKFNSTSWEQVGSAGFSVGDAYNTSLAIDNGTPYVAYHDNYRNKANMMKFNGSSWEQVPVGSTGFSAGAGFYTSLAFDNGTPYVAYLSGNSNKANVMMYNGTSWVQVGNADFSAAQADCISLAFYNGTPYVAFQDWGNGRKASVMKLEGSSWVQVGTAGFSVGVADKTSLAFDDDGTPYVAYSDGGNGNKGSVMKFDGTSWVPVNSGSLAPGDTATWTQTFNSKHVGSGKTLTPAGAVNDGNGGNNYAVTFVPVTTGVITPRPITVTAVTDSKVYDGTTTSSGVPSITIPAGFSAGGAMNTSLAIDSSGTPYVAYRDVANGYKASVMKFNGTSWVQVGNPGFSAGEAQFTSLAIANGIPYVAYRDVANGDKASVMKYNGTSWVQVGSAGFTAGVADGIQLAFHNDTPYVAYMDGANSNKASVMKLENNIWEQVGSAGFSANMAAYMSLAFSNGLPYVSYVDWGNSGRASVMMYSGTSWVQVGDPGFTPGQAYYTSLAFDSSGMPNVAFQDGSQSWKASAMKYNGTIWVPVGNAGFSTGQANSLSLAFDSSGTPYVAYQDFGNGGKASVMKLNGNSWVPVGSAGFSPGQASSTSLAINSSGMPYVAYRDETNYKASLMKFDGTSWVPVNSGGLATGDTATWTQTFDNKDVGSGKTLTPAGAVNDGNSGNNYAVTFVNDTTGAITQKPITVTADNIFKEAGAVDPPLTYQVTSGGLVTGESFTGVLDRVDGETTGTYDILQGTLSAGGNYNLTYVKGIFTINPHIIPLALGWNLVSIDLVPTDPAIGVVLASIAGKYDLVYAWDATGAHSSSGNWMKYDPSAGFGNTLNTLTVKMGLWINMTSAGNLVVNGNPLPAAGTGGTNIDLLTTAGGWNLVGYPDDGSVILPDALILHGVDNGSYTMVYAYHAADTGDPWKLYDKNAPGYANGLTSMSPTWGYWIFVTQDEVWTVGD